MHAKTSDRLHLREQGMNDENRPFFEGFDQHTPQAMILQVQGCNNSINSATNGGGAKNKYCYWWRHVGM